MTNHLALVGITLHQVLGDRILFGITFGIGHHGVVQIRIELLAFCRNDLYIEVLKHLFELLIDTTYALRKGVVLILRIHGTERTLEIIDHWKQLLDDLACTEVEVL